MIIAIILLATLLLALGVRYWPWSKEEIERGTDYWKERTTHNGVPISEWREQSAFYVLYRVTNRYTKSVTIKKEYLD